MRAANDRLLSCGVFVQVESTRRYSRVRWANATTMSVRLVSRSTIGASWATGNGLSKVAPPLSAGQAQGVRSIPRLCVIVNGACMHHGAMIVTATAHEDAPREEGNPRGVFRSRAAVVGGLCVATAPCGAGWSRGSTRPVHSR
jgi:hypothetical protein